MRYARTLDSATVSVHKALINPSIFTDLLDIGIKNNCYALSKDASEDVVALSGEMDDMFIRLYKSRYMRALEKGPTHVRTYDLQPDDLVVAHYHCGIPPEPSSIDIDTMKLALRAQLHATVPGKPRVFGIISPVVTGRSFCLDLGIYEPVPDMNIAYNIRRLRIKDVSVLEERRKGFARYEFDGDYLIVELCDEPSEPFCLPFRYGDVADITLEDFIFIGSYYVNTGEDEFAYFKVTPTKSVAYEVKVTKLVKERAVIRGVVWGILRASTRGPRSI